MAEIRIPRLEQGQAKIKTVPIAVTPEGFWCCPSPVVFQKTHKTQNPLNKSKSSPPPPTSRTSSQKKPSTQVPDGRPSPNLPRPPDDQRTRPEAPAVGERPPRSKIENAPRKVSIEFGEPGTSDLKVVLLGKQGFAVRLSVHKEVLSENSSFFKGKFLEQHHHPDSPCLEIDDCEDAEIYVETVGLMYCKDLKQRLIKQNVSRVLRILKVAEQLGFTSCIQTCLEYLEAVPWVGDEEEEKVVSSVLRLQEEGIKVTPVLKRVASDASSNPPNDTICHILDLVLKSNEERGRREMKSVVLKLLKENISLPSSSGLADICNRTCLEYATSLLSLFRQAADQDFSGKSSEVKDPVMKLIATDSDNLFWLLEILADRQGAEDFAAMWASQVELATLHPKLPTVSRHHVSSITARVFVGIGKGEILPTKDTRLMLLQTWLQPLIDDYRWLQHGSRQFDRKVVEEGIGRTILTLPLLDQQRILLAWLGSFLKGGDNCPNLQRAFEVWWRRSFIRPYVDPAGSSSSLRLEESTTVRLGDLVECADAMSL